MGLQVQNKIHISGYDLIKLAYLLVVLGFGYGIYHFTSHGTPISEANLPAYPPAPFEWKYNADSRELTNPQGVQLYRLSAKGDVWQPVVPASFLLQLPGRYTVKQNKGGLWQILDVNGAVVSSWNPVTFAWTLGQIPTPTRDRSTTTPTPNLTPSPTPLKTLRSLPPTFTPTPTITPTGSQASCNTRIVSRLTAGKTARVLINLNMHTAPEMTDNVFNGSPSGELVDVLQGPVCVPYLNSAYWWWQIRNSKGAVGWSVESMLNTATYFLEPVD